MSRHCPCDKPSTKKQSSLAHARKILDELLADAGRQTLHRTMWRLSLRSFGLDFVDSSLWPRVYSLGLGASGLGLTAQGSGFRVQGLAFRVWGLGCSALSLALDPARTRCSPPRPLEWPSKEGFKVQLASAIKHSPEAEPCGFRFGSKLPKASTPHPEQQKALKP